MTHISQGRQILRIMVEICQNLVKHTNTQVDNSHQLQLNQISDKLTWWTVTNTHYIRTIAIYQPTNILSENLIKLWT